MVWRTDRLGGKGLGKGFNQLRELNIRRFTINTLISSIYLLSRSLYEFRLEQLYLNLVFEPGRIGCRRLKDSKMKI